MSRYVANKKVQQRQREKVEKILFIPIMILLGIVPLITRLKMSDPSPIVAKTFKLQKTIDFFSYYKASAIGFVMAVMILMVFFTITKEDVKRYKNMLLYMGAAGVFLLFTVLSALFSPYTKEALWGVPGRAEGMVIIICYVVMMRYTIFAFRSIKDFRYILIGLSVLVLVTTFLGIFEYMGKNLLLNTEIGRKLLVPEEYAQFRDKLQVSYEKGKVYGTMFHYNYMGSFGAMMVPLFGTLMLYIKGIKEKMALSILTIASMFLLFGSTSRGGLIGVGLALVIGIVIFSKNIIKNWKVTLPVFAGLVVVLLAFNMLTGGTIFERIPSLAKDTMTGISSKDKDFNYLDYIPIRDVKTEQGKITFETQKDALTLVKDQNVVKLLDRAGNEIPALDTPMDITIQDERFQGIILKKIFDTNQTWRAAVLNINGADTFVIRMDDAAGLYLMDTLSQEKIDLEFPETFGFKGKEKLGSARGYIWSRSIPMLKKTLFVGHGPDTYAFEFPQNDFLGKYYAYDTPNMIVDKPHNLYLQIGINEGVIALIAFLVLVIAYIVQGIKLYGLKEIYGIPQSIGVAVMLAVIGYLGAGFFNDSIVSVAPIFWILLGIGLAINYLNQYQLNKYNQ